MRPLESQVPLTSHVVMFNRIKELLMHEGLLSTDPSDDDVRHAINRWVTMVESAAKNEVVTH